MNKIRTETEVEERERDEEHKQLDEYGVYTLNKERRLYTGLVFIKVASEVVLLFYREGRLRTVCRNDFNLKTPLYALCVVKTPPCTVIDFCHVVQR